VRTLDHETRQWLRDAVNQKRREQTLVGLCPVCLNRIPDNPTKPRKFCSARCAGRTFMNQPLVGRSADYLLGKCG
jgi:hypothetical protein